MRHAVAGAIRALHAHGKNGGTATVLQIEKLEGLEVDLTEDAIESSVGIASWRALDYLADSFSISAEGGKWVVEYLR